MAYMKHIIYITALLLPFMAGCSKPNSSVTPEEFERYIFFSQGIDTKVPLIESADAMGQFGVVGFKYGKTMTWDEYKTTDPAPNVFYNDESTSPVTVETLSCNGDGSSSYTPLQGWSNISRYAFFAYYPFGDDNVVLVNPDGSTYIGGTPALKYTMNATNAQALKNSMADLMTSYNKDLYWSSSTDNNLVGDDVKLTFTHKLSSLGVNLKNSTSGAVTVNSLYISVSQIQHKQIIIPLDGSPASYGDTDAPVSGNMTCQMTLSDTDKIITSSGVEISDKLIFIPQSEDLRISITVGYTRSVQGYTEYFDTFSSSLLYTKLEEGNKYLIYLTFTDSTVEVKQGSGAWSDAPTVDNTFN